MNAIQNSERYRRQVILEELGESGQRKLANARVLVIGAGGLGCPVLLYLCAAGIGTIGIIDDDTVSESNLHRQVLYTPSDIGLLKVDCAKRALMKMNPDCNVLTYPERLVNRNALSLFNQFDLIIDGTDNFASRYLVNDAAVLTGRPVVFGAVSKFEAQLAVFNLRIAPDQYSTNYRDLFPEAPPEGEILNCEQAGVLGVLPGIIGTMMATEAIKLLTGIGKPLVDRVLTINILTNQFYEMELERWEGSIVGVPMDAASFLDTDYDFLCGAAPAVMEINGVDLETLIHQHSKRCILVDVREEGELPLISEFSHLRLPLSQWTDGIDQIDADSIVFICQSGKRSQRAANKYAEKWGRGKEIFSLKDGIVGWQQNQVYSK